MSFREAGLSSCEEELVSCFELSGLRCHEPRACGSAGSDVCARLSSSRDGHWTVVSACRVSVKGFCDDECACLSSSRDGHCGHW